MSIYKGWEPIEGPGKYPRKRNDAEPVHLRKAQPVGTPLPRTIAWLRSLPPHARPIALTKRFARIANAIAISWDQPAECRQYFDDLFSNRRGHRKGFPEDVLLELQRLRELHRSLFPAEHGHWVPVRTMS